ncbi:MAG: MBL fold metallo-hydrolase [Candidatus Pelagadaptatus aseana]|uniref:MBL fold metallo-hydrolase RNA specificity domain-containing protein n=1 Tax=Candidatus Pelagadaptatus aseana TaxID=3120508 RepID=UPI0039B36267
MATITFIGAAQKVTGSCHLLDSPATGKVLLDCGMHQGHDAIERMQQERFAFEPAEIDAVILSHAHLDHSGLLPKLVNQGFRGDIFCTRASKDLLNIMLQDSAGLYLRDLERENLRRARRGQKALQPEYRQSDVKQVLKQCQTADYGEQLALGTEATIEFHDAGHILGSSIIDITLKEQGKTKRLVFSGDLGKKSAALMKDPEHLHQADVVLMEGTYGDRNHRSLDDTFGQLRDILHQAWEDGGNVMIPSFAVGRTQEILFHLGRLLKSGELDPWQIFLDSPMAIEITKVYDRWINLLDKRDTEPLFNGKSQPLQTFLPNLQFAVTPDESMAINKIRKGAIIIAGSGMCTGGRIRHHFKHRIWNKRNTLVFIGFQAHGTLGRILVNGAKRVRMFGEEYVVKANIETLGGFSAHAGQSELIEWAGHFRNNPRLMLVHGEPQALDALSHKLWENRISSEVPRQGQSIVF